MGNCCQDFPVSHAKIQQEEAQLQQKQHHQEQHQQEVHTPMKLIPLTQSELPPHNQSPNHQQIIRSDPLDRLIQQSDEKALRQAGELIQLPQLNPIVAQTLSKWRFFDQQFSTLPPFRKKIGKEVYVGYLDEKKQKPQGFGKLYKENGSLYIGNFEQGRYSGLGVMIFGNGSFYKGNFTQNGAECSSGEFHSSNFRYWGGFKANLFHGAGKEQGEKYQFDGEYGNGAKVSGKLRWFDSEGEYEYEGSFNSNNKFHGKGTLKNVFGLYEGEFVDGLKHGKGSFLSKSGFKYVGEYANGVKSGQGAIYGGDGALIFAGEMRSELAEGSKEEWAGWKQEIVGA